MQWLTYKTPMLKAPQQPLKFNDKHFTKFAVVHRNQDALNFKTPNRRTFLGQAVSDN
ncbi:hypothetical protein [Vibrio parahaemolyticus]|uniref:hypothetical protein n=1 Tax=Vibrio parahaemolyticus TaxID=670 RepID=UPI00193DA409|nr:hypothetical protein [Vibrio parahaemolyticus]EHK4786506.1 hypothetical protein [Vibrio parahaemolyticus]EIJ0976112.1 hypothetical protein [Vibrio parahaemolyticus]MBM4991967.1 hypothetical protein [Vibrio parahaemolyticus]MBM4996521.1 hypothetical protein [Vibrio parahaemolyticus]MCG6485337.1 hypothetical protein [Vibrio parahaemolyticus]